MKLYIHDERTNGTIIRACEDAGVDILTPAMIAERDEMPQEYSFFLDQVDALMLEVTQPSQVVHFILAQAILTKKPALCLYAKNQPPREVLNYVRRASGPRVIKTFSYTGKTICEAVNRFIEQHDTSRTLHHDSPKIKYTLRLTPRIDEYVEWLSRQQDMTKADAIRALLSDSATNNTDFQSSLE